MVMGLPGVPTPGAVLDQVQQAEQTVSSVVKFFTSPPVLFALGAGVGLLAIAAWKHVTEDDERRAHALELARYYGGGLVP